MKDRPVCGECFEREAQGVWVEQRPDGSWAGYPICNDCAEARKRRYGA